ncbi:C-terminal binding protein [Chloroflexota bacterium]
MSFRVVMTARVLSRRDVADFQQGLGVELVSIPCQTEDELIAATEDADAVITLMQPFSRRVIEKLKHCRLIYNAGVGFETIDVAAATERGICVAYPGDYCVEEVSDHAMALLLACARKITRLDRAVRAGKWSAFEKREIHGKILPATFQLRGQTLGLVGLGRIGRAIVPKAKGFGMRVIAADPYLTPDIFRGTGVESVTLEQLLESSDFVLILAPFSPVAEHMISTEQLKKMKATAYIINVARGAFIDEAALHTALSEGYIAGAGLDAVAAEPEGISPEHPLLTLDNVIITAHSAYYSEQSTVRYKQRMYEALVSAVRGEMPEWMVNPEVRGLTGKG